MFIVNLFQNHFSLRSSHRALPYKDGVRQRLEIRRVVLCHCKESDNMLCLYYSTIGWERRCGRQWAVHNSLSHTLCSLSHRYCCCRFIIALVKSTVTYSRTFNRKPSNLCTLSRKYSEIVSKSNLGFPESPKNMFRKV